MRKTETTEIELRYNVKCKCYLVNLKSYREALLGSWYFDLFGSCNIELKNFDTVLLDKSCTMV